VTARDEDKGTSTVPIAEETAVVDRETVTSGRVRVTTAVEWHDETVAAELSTEKVEVTTVPVGRVVVEPPRVRVEGDVTIVPVVEEQLVVERRLVLREEIHLRRVTETTPVELPVTLRRQRAEIERSEGPSPRTDEETAS
jgi:stress response protein YsnF